MQQPPIGIILAGGQSLRMNGTHKASLKLQGTPLIEHVKARLSPQVSDIAISVGPAPSATHYAEPVCYDDGPEHFGPLSGLLAGLKYASRVNASHIVTAPCDTPFLPCDLVPQLQLAAEKTERQCAISSSPSGLQPSTALWPTSLIPDLQAFLASGERRLSLWADITHAGIACFSDETAFFNINTQQDLHAAQALLTQ